jgi:hypothetical protein
VVLRKIRMIKEFVMEIKAKLSARAIGRRAAENNEGYELKEAQSP